MGPNMMDEIYIKVPVVCPICRQESLIALRAEAIIEALDEEAPLRLVAACHDKGWYASEVETEQIRDYLLCTMKFANPEGPWMKPEVSGGSRPDSLRSEGPGR
jgi:hypothetical protein